MVTSTKYGYVNKCHDDRMSFLYLGSNYNDFRFNRKAFNINSILQEKDGIVIVFLCIQISGKLTCLNMYPRGNGPQVSVTVNGGHRYLQIFKRNLPKETKRVPDKKFWFIDYNCRKDPYISKKVENTLNLFTQMDIVTKILYLYFAPITDIQIPRKELLLNY